LGISFIGHKGSLQDLVRYAKTAEEIGFDVISCPDDFWFRDVFTVFSVIAKETERVALFPITNPYSRKPAMIAREAVTLDEVSNGRVYLGLCSGGSLTLRPLSIPMWDRPLTTLKETVEICRMLSRGEAVNFDGETVHLNDARFLFTPFRDRFPILFVGRGPKILEMAGMIGDGLLLGGVPKCYIDFGIKQITKGALKAGKSVDEMKIHGTITYSKTSAEEFERFLKWRVPNIIMDTPYYVFEKAEIDAKTMEAVEKIKKCRSVPEAGEFVNKEAIDMYSFANTPEAFLEEADELLQKGVNGISVIVPPGQEDLTLPVIRDEIMPHLKRNVQCRST
jgi:5,10-methylenetetrahydromethanopterin reductase